jgi:hypothetical protein
MMENQGALRQQWWIIVLSAAFLGKFAYDKIITMSQNKRQRSINDFSGGILDNLTGMQRR